MVAPSIGSQARRNYLQCPPALGLKAVPAPTGCSWRARSMRPWNEAGPAGAGNNRLAWTGGSCPWLATGAPAGHVFYLLFANRTKLPREQVGQAGPSAPYTG